MKPIINPWWFYLVDVIGSFKIGCLVLLVFGVLGFGATMLLEYDEVLDESDEVKVIKTLKKMVIVGALVITFDMFLPTKETCYKMMVASQVTEENIQKAEDVIKDSVDYIFEKINKE